MLYSKNPTGLEACRTGTKMRFKTKPSLPESAVAKIPATSHFADPLLLSCYLTGPIRWPFPIDYLSRKFAVFAFRSLGKCLLLRKTVDPVED